MDFSTPQTAIFWQLGWPASPIGSLILTTKQDGHLSIMYQCRDASDLMPSGNHLQDVMRRFEAATLVPLSGYAIESPLHAFSPVQWPVDRMKSHLILRIE